MITHNPAQLQASFHMNPLQWIKYYFPLPIKGRWEKIQASHSGLGQEPPPNSAQPLGSLASSATVAT